MSDWLVPRPSYSIDHDNQPLTSAKLVAIETSIRQGVTLELLAQYDAQLSNSASSTHLTGVADCALLLRDRPDRTGR